MAAGQKLYTYNIKSNLLHSHTGTCIVQQDNRSSTNLEPDGPVGYQTDCNSSKVEPSIGRFANKMHIDPPKHKTESKKKKKQKKKETEPEEKYPSPTNSIGESYSEAAQKARNGVQGFGFTDEEILMSLTQLQAEKVAITTDSLIDKVYEVQEHLLSLPTPSLPSPTHTGALCTDGAPGSDGEDSGDESDTGSTCSVSSEENSRQQYQKAVDAERERLQDAIDDMIIRCRVCNTSRATILLLPCGHLVSCEDCLMDVRRCPVPRCNKVVRGTKEVFFA